MPDTSAGQPDKITVNKPLPAAPDPDALNIQRKGGADHCPDGGIHAGCVPAAGQNADSFDVSHTVCLPVRIFLDSAAHYTAENALKQEKEMHPEQRSSETEKTVPEDGRRSLIFLNFTDS